MIELVGWLGTFFVLLGYVFNIKRRLRLALVMWIVGDVLWITYDLVRDIYPHLGLSAVIITINLYGLISLRRTR